MKNLIAAALTASLLATSVSAGNLAEPLMEPEVIAEESSSSIGGYVVPIMLVALLAAVLSSSGNDSVPLASDARLKTDVIRTGTAANGLPIYQYSYIGLPGTFEGVMAQDVLLHTPEAVVEMPGGYYGVDYEMLGLEMRRIN